MILRMHADSAVQPEGLSNCGLSLMRLSPPYANVERVFNPNQLRSSTEALASMILVGINDPIRDHGPLTKWVPRLRSMFPANPVVLLFPSSQDPNFIHLAAQVMQLHVRAIIVEGEPLTATLRKQLTEPAGFGPKIEEWLGTSGFIIPSRLAPIIRRIIDKAGAIEHTGMSKSDRSIRSWCADAGLPAPREWRGLAQGIRAALRIQRDQSIPVLTIALELGYSDHSALSRQIVRLFNTRPETIRKTLGWEWLMARWVETWR